MKAPPAGVGDAGGARTWGRKAADPISLALVAVLIVIVLWWPPEVYGDLKYPGYAFMFLVLFWSVWRRPASLDPVPTACRSVSIGVSIFSILLLVSLALSVDSYRSAETILGYAAPAAMAIGIALIRPMSETSALGAPEALIRPMSETSALGAPEALIRPMSETSALGAPEALIRPMSETSALGAPEALIRDDRFVDQVESILIGMVGLLSFYGIYQYLFSLPDLLVRPGAWSGLDVGEVVPALTRMAGGRIFSRFALPSSFACVLLAALPLVHRRLLESPRPYLYAAILVAMAACMVLIRSYGALILFCGYWLTDVWIRQPKFRTALILIAVALAGLVIPFLRSDSLLDFSGPANPVRLRLANWSVAWSEFRSAPVFGVGPGNYGLLFAAYSPGLTETRYAHGFHMTMLAETGAAGILSWFGLVAMFSLWLKNSRPSSAVVGDAGTWGRRAADPETPALGAPEALTRPRHAAGLVMLFLYSLIDIVFELPSLCFLFFFLLGLSLPPRGAAKRLTRPAWGIAAVAGVSFSLVLSLAHGYHESGMEMMGLSRATSREIRSAGFYFEKARNLWPNPAFDAAHGWSNVLLARTEKNPEYLNAAYRDYSNAVRKSPDAVRYRAGFGETLLLMGDSPRAAIQFKEAARLNPRGPYAGRYLQLILDRGSQPGS